MSREDWLTEFAAQVGAPLTSREDLRPADDLVVLGGQDLTAALIVASVAANHSNGHLLEAVVERVASGRWMTDGVDHGDVAIAAISTYRLGRLPGPKWWDAVTVEVSLLECWADRALRSVPRAKVEELLRKRWLVEEKAISVLADGFGNPGVGLLEQIESRAAQSPRIEQVLDLKETKAAMAKARAALPEAFAEHRQVADLRSGIGFLAALEQVLSDGPGEREAQKELKDLGEKIKRTIKEEILHLSVLEASAFEPISESERLLRETVEGTRRRIHVPAFENGTVIPNGLSDQFQGETLATDHLIDEVFSAGSRSGLLAWGPTAYMWLALARHELPPDGVLPLGLGVLADGDIPFDLILQIAAEEEDPLSMDYRVGHTDETRRWLAMLTLSERITIDIFEIDPNGRLQLILRSTQDVKDLAAKLRPRIVKSIEDADPAPFLTGNELEEHVLAGFGLSENAKSELLLRALV